MFRLIRCAICFGYTLLLTFLLFGSESNAQTSDSPTQVQSIGDDVLSDADIRLEARIRQAIFQPSKNGTGKSWLSIYDHFQGSEFDRFIEFIYAKHPKLSLDPSYFDRYFTKEKSTDRKERFLRVVSRLCRSESNFGALACSPSQFENLADICTKIMKSGVKPPPGFDLALVQAVRTNHNYAAYRVRLLLEAIQNHGFAANEEMRERSRFSFDHGRLLIDSIQDRNTFSTTPREATRFLFYNVPPEKIEPAFYDVLERFKRLDIKKNNVEYNKQYEYWSVLRGLAKEIPQKRAAALLVKFLAESGADSKSDFYISGPVVSVLGERLSTDDFPVLVLAWANETDPARGRSIAKRVSPLFAKMPFEERTAAANLVRKNLRQKIAQNDLDSLIYLSSELMDAVNHEQDTTIATIVFQRYSASLSSKQSFDATLFCVKRLADLSSADRATSIERALSYAEKNHNHYACMALGALHTQKQLLRENHVKRAIAALQSMPAGDPRNMAIPSLRKRFASLLAEKRKESK